MRIAVLGASGFVGSRFIEKMHLTGEAQVRPIVRNFSSLARMARFDLDWRVTDLSDVPKLTAALQECDVVLHSIVGDESVILGTIQPVYRAAQLAGVRRIIYLSSSSVHGLTPDVSTTEDSPLSDQQAFAYNNAKVRAERLWATMRTTGTVEVVGLRPSIVFGPRSRWVSDLAEEAKAHTAYLLQGGGGICNTIYVDNLVQAVVLAADASKVDGQYFLVRDEETVTWKDFYQPILEAFEASLQDVHAAEAPVVRRSWQERASNLRTLPPLKLIKPLFPSAAVRMAKAALNALPAPVPASPWQDSRGPRPRVTAEIAALQLCNWRMPCAKAEKLLGYKPEISFSEGMHRSIGWLKFAGYPVKMAQ
jgi:nucleoside-diphosphate-sugar epimerase